MVGTESNSHDRGQVILIGAITLAFIILGIVVVFNGILYTEALSTGSSSQSATDVEIVEYEVADGVGGLAHYENIEGEWGDADAYEDDLANHINGSNEFADQYRNTTANSRPVVANVSFNEIDENATVTTGTFDGIGDEEIEGIDSRVGHLELNLTPTPNEELTVNATSGEGESTVTIYSDSDGEAFSVNDVDCNIEGDQARFDLVAGDVDLRLDDCDAEEVEHLEENLSIIDVDESYERIELSDENGSTEGTFELVVKGWDEGNVLDPEELIEETHYGAWSVTVDVTYESHDVSYERTQTVYVYGGDG
ncbi:hypothetical protein [Natronococcus wangiae]|uniref:hypothetical protein n=1 Tax=Natronococcus wangiae TaxID=3068275 RepID=UPI00273E62E3|nr:hypothetical protein [Natronococcus sp. AD5]